MKLALTVVTLFSLLSSVGFAELSDYAGGWQDSFGTKIQVDSRSRTVLISHLEESPDFTLTGCGLHGRIKGTYTYNYRKKVKAQGLDPVLCDQHVYLLFKKTGSGLSLGYSYMGGGVGFELTPVPTTSGK